MNTKQKRERLDKNRDLILVEDCPMFSNYERVALVDKLYNRDVKVDYRIRNEQDFKRLFTLCELLPLYRDEIKKFMGKYGNQLKVTIPLDKRFLKICEKRIIAGHRQYGNDWVDKQNLQEAEFEKFDIFNYTILDRCQKRLREE